MIPLGQKQKLLVSDHPTDPNFNPRPNKIFFIKKKKKKKKKKKARERKKK
jgi:uncharacterized protein YigE (DUF2233 family)